LILFWVEIQPQVLVFSCALLWKENRLLTLAFYVDDFIYFSASDAVERNFESLFSTVGNVDFMGQVSLFHGIEFSWLHLSDGHINAGLMQQPLLKFILNLWVLSLSINLLFLLLIIQVFPMIPICMNLCCLLNGILFVSVINPWWVV
jgi:hypothetical protein